MDEFKGFENGGKTLIKCEDCGKALVTILNIKPSTVEKKKIKVFCGSCKGHSKVYEIDAEEIRMAIGNDGVSKTFIDYDICYYDKDENIMEIETFC